MYVPMNTGSFDTGGAILPALAAFFCAPTFQAHPPIVVAYELMFLLDVLLLPAPVRTFGTVAMAMV